MLSLLVAYSLFLLVVGSLLGIHWSFAQATYDVLNALWGILFYIFISTHPRFLSKGDAAATPPSKDT